MEVTIKATGRRYIPLLVCVLPDPAPNAARTTAYGDYVHEILEHAGIPISAAEADDLAAQLASTRILLTIGDCALPSTTIARLQGWVQAGGAWIAVGGVCGAAELFGIEVAAPAYASWGGGSATLGEGYLRPAAASSLLDHLAIPLHYFNGLPVRADTATVLARCLDTHGHDTDRAAVCERSVGDGHCILIAPDLTGTVVRIQQGLTITRDGIPAPDGTAPIADGVLKSDDGQVLDWILDREPVPSVPGFSAFLHPIADLWRELLIRAILYAADRTHTALPMLWLYTNNLPALAHMSHDTDGNDPSLGRQLLDLVDTLGIHTTWCVILPGYDAGLISAIRESGHELAMHYDAMGEGTEWGEQEFDEQWLELMKLFGGERPSTNKNHYLRWEGDCELWEWCAARGIRLDQSKGASKTGEAGFNFGTCHPYVPVRPSGAQIDVLELPTPTQDLIVFAPVELLDSLLESVLRSHGILHLLFHPAHVAKPGIADAIREAVNLARAAGMQWWTARQISDWERARRTCQWSAGRNGQIRIRSTELLPNATVLWPDPGGDLERWGFRFRARQIDILPGKDYVIDESGVRAVGEIA